MKWAGHVRLMGDMRNAYSILVGKPERNITLRRPRRRREDNIIVDFREIGWEGVDWIHLAKDKDQCQTLVNKVMKLRVP